MGGPSSDIYLSLLLRFFVRKDPQTGKPVPWLADQATVKALVDGLLSVPLFESVTLARVDDDDLAEVDHAQAATMVATGDELMADLQDRDVRNTDLAINLDLRPSRAEVRINVSGAELARHRDRALDDLITAAQQSWQALHGVAGLNVGYIRVDAAARELEYPKPRPPRESNLYPTRTIVELIDRAYHATGHAFARPTDPEALTVPAPPAPAQVTETDDLVTVRWAKTLDEDEVLAAASDHDAWIADRLKLDLQPGFNELGDQREERGDAEARPPLTLYDTDNEVGYKAVLVLPDGSVEQDAWDEAAAIATAHQLPDGTPVKYLRLVVPLREHVFPLRERAKQAGFDTVVYPDDDGQFWDPDPPGAWRSPPTGSSAPKTAES